MNRENEGAEGCRARRSRVLVVDDDPGKRELLTFALDVEGFEVETVNDGIAALEVLARPELPDLVITDVMMPGLDGYELVRRIRSNPVTRFVPVMIQTAARVTDEDRKTGMALGSLGYITDFKDLSLLIAQAKTLVEMRRYMEQARQEAETDHLTGLANRRQFERALAAEIARTDRYGRPFCLLMLDIDHFKAVNDTYGHPAGDRVIQALADTVRRTVRGIDTAARVGGEEFAVLLPETKIDEGGRTGERLRAAAAALDVEGVGRITVSVGVAEYPMCADTGEALVGVADESLYVAKQGGRDRVVMAEALARPFLAGEREEGWPM